jgi:hypothetical protein
MTVPDQSVPGQSVPWRPANDAEWALAEAVTSDDRRGFFRILTTATLFLPRFTGEDIVTVELFGQRFVPLFTSTGAVPARIGEFAEGFTEVDYPWLRRGLIGTGLRLAFNPDTPIEAYVSVEGVELAARGELVVPTAAQLAASLALEQARPQNELETALLAAVEAQDADAYANALLNADVIVPTLVEVADLGRILDPEFPWLVAGTQAAPAIPVFTSPALLHLALGAPGPALTLPFAVLAGAWPDGHRLCVNPGTTFGLELPAEQAPLLLLWRDRQERGQAAPPQAPAPRPR